MKKHLLHFLLLLITPSSLYLNFFKAEATLKNYWPMDIKAWAYYSLILTASKIIIIIICNYLMFKLLQKQKIWDLQKIDRFNNLSTTSFLIANVYFIFPMHGYLWLYVPLFSFATILIIGYIFFRKENGDKITLKYIFYVKKSDDSEKYNTKILLTTGILYFVFHLIFQWSILNYIYNPYRVSLRTYVGEDAKIIW